MFLCFTVFTLVSLYCNKKADEGVRHESRGECHGTFWNSRTPADLNALGPGYGFRPDLVTIPQSPLTYAFCALGARNVGSNVQNDVAGPVT